MTTMEKDVINLGVVLKNIDNFDMSTFNGRLILQKTVYLMQSFGIYVGYDFSWYLRGPYSTKLARNGFALQEVYGNLPTGYFAEKEVQEKFRKFLNFIKNKKTNADQLEILASIHFLKKVYPTMKKPEIIEKVKKKQSYFTKTQCENAWIELKRIEMI